MENAIPCPRSAERSPDGPKRIEIRFIAQEHSGELSEQFTQLLQAALTEKKIAPQTTQVILATQEVPRVAEDYLRVSKNVVKVPDTVDENNLSPHKLFGLKFYQELEVSGRNIAPLDDVVSVAPNDDGAIYSGLQVPLTVWSEIKRRGYMGFPSDQMIERCGEQMRKIVEPMGEFLRRTASEGQDKLAQIVDRTIKTSSAPHVIILVDTHCDRTDFLFEALRGLPGKVANNLGITPDKLSQFAKISMSYTIDRKGSPLTVYDPISVAARQLAFAEKLGNPTQSPDRNQWEKVLFAQIANFAFYSDAFREPNISKNEWNRALLYILQRLPDEAIHAFLRESTDVYPEESEDDLADQLDHIIVQRERRNELLRQYENTLHTPFALPRGMDRGKPLNDDAIRQYALPVLDEQRMRIEQLNRQVEELGLLNYDDGQANAAIAKVTSKFNRIHDRREYKRQQIREMIETQLAMMQVFIASATGEEVIAKKQEYNRLLKAYQTVDCHLVRIGSGGNQQFSAKPSARLHYYSEGEIA